MRNLFNRCEGAKKEVYDKAESLTMPGLEVKIASALQKVQRGERVQNVVGMYESVTGVSLPPNFDKMSKIEKLQLQRKVTNEVTKKREKLSVLDAKNKEVKAKQEAKAVEDAKGSGDK